MSIYILGELNVDMIISGTDIVPEWNREKLADSFDLVLGSSSAITACALSGLGLDVKFVSVVGDDEFGRFCIQKLRERGVNTKYVQVKSGVQTGVTLSFSTPKDRGLVTYMGSISSLSPDEIPESLFGEAAHIHFGSYYLQDGMREHWAQVFHKARSMGISTSFDTGWDVRNNWQRGNINVLLEHTDLFIPSEEELLHIYGAGSLDKVWGALPSNHHWILIKRGARGSVLVSPEGNTMEMNAYNIEPIDTTGAGDSFNAGAISGFLSGIKGAEWLRFANACGASSTQRIGGAESIASLSDIVRFQETHSLRD